MKATNVLQYVVPSVLDSYLGKVDLLYTIHYTLLSKVGSRESAFYNEPYVCTSMFYVLCGTVGRLLDSSSSSPVG